MPPDTWGVVVGCTRAPVHGTVPRRQTFGTPDREGHWPATTLDRAVFEPSVVESPAAGEALMLWKQDALWAARGRAGNGTRAVLKYKPVVLGVGVVYKAPYHSHRRLVVNGDNDDDAGGRLPGYHVRLRWWDPIHFGQSIRVLSYTSDIYT